MFFIRPILLNARRLPLGFEVMPLAAARLLVLPSPVRSPYHKRKAPLSRATTTAAATTPPSTAMSTHFEFCDAGVATPPLGLGLAALGRPGYINLGHDTGRGLPPSTPSPHLDHFLGNTLRGVVSGFQ